jgi:hypothetical protein
LGGCCSCLMDDGPQAVNIKHIKYISFKFTL